MKDINKIKSRIKNLLNKTVENGCSEQEMNAALTKAKELMTAHFISRAEIENDPYLNEKCVLRKIEKVKSSYNFGYFYTSLSRLFDCEYYFNNTEIVFFGFVDDVDLCEYFYYSIIRSALYNAELFKKTQEYKTLKRQGHHGRSIKANFLKGFLIRIATKLRKLYLQRKSDIPYGMGLVLVNKEKRVKDDFNNLGFNIRTVCATKPNLRQAAAAGSKRAESFSITQGIKTKNQEGKLLID